MALTWVKNGDTLEGHYEGRLRFTVQREKKIWTLWRWRFQPVNSPGGSEREDGAVFQAKERVRNQLEGVAYANKLHESAVRDPKEPVLNAKVLATESDRLTAIYNQWDALNNTIQRILVAQPHQMTERAAALEEERAKMFAAIMGRTT